MTGRVMVALRADGRTTLCGCVDVATLRMAGPSIAASSRSGIQGASALVAQALCSARRDGVEVAGLALAHPGEDVWRDWASTLAARFDLPATSLGIAQAAMRGEQLHGAAIGASALLFDTDELRTGLLLHGRPYDGASGAAGDVAHLGLDRTGNVRCMCGRLGCLAALVHAGREAPVPPLPNASRPMPSRQHGWLAVAAIALLNVVNPQTLILGGSAIETEPELEWLADTVRLGCLAPTRAGLAHVARVQTNSALVGTAAFAFTRQSQTTL